MEKLNFTPQSSLFRKFSRKRKQMLDMVIDTYKVVIKDQELNQKEHCINDLKIGQMLCSVYQSIYPNKVEDIALYSSFFQEQLEAYTH